MNKTLEKILEDELFDNETFEGEGNLQIKNTSEGTKMPVFPIGNSYQDGEPTPENSVAIKNSGDNTNEFNPDGKVDDTHKAFYPKSALSNITVGLPVFDSIVDHNYYCLAIFKIKANETKFFYLTNPDYCFRANGVEVTNNEGIIQKICSDAHHKYTATMDGFIVCLLQKVSNGIFTDEDIEKIKNSFVVKSKFSTIKPNNSSSLNVILCNRNIGSAEHLYQQMHMFAPRACREEVVDNKDCIVFGNYYFNEQGAEFKFFQGRFKKNTQYIVKFKTKRYDKAAKGSIALRFNYEDGPGHSTIINDDSGDWFDYEIISKKNESVDSLSFYYVTNDYYCIDKDSIIIEEYTGEEPDFIRNEEQSIDFPLEEGQELCGLKTEDKSVANFIDSSGQAWICDYLAKDGIHKRTFGVKLTPENIFYSGLNNTNGILNVIFGIQTTTLKHIPIGKCGLCTIAPYSASNESSTEYEALGFYVMGSKEWISIHIPKSRLGLTLESTTAEINQAIKDYVSSNNVYLLLGIEEEEIIPYLEAQQEAYTKLMQAVAYDDTTNIICTDEIPCNFKVNAKISKIKKIMEGEKQI